MKKAALALLLAASPLAAQDWELGLFLGQQQYKSFEVAPVKTEVSDEGLMTFRLGYSFVDLGPCLFQLTAGYQPESKATFKAFVSGTPLGEAEYKHSAASVGAMFNFKAFIAIGAGIEYRFEKLEAETESTTYNRPWVRANVGYAFPFPVIKPFIGVEVAVPLTSTSNDSATAADVLKSNAPELQVGLYGGLRF